MLMLILNSIPGTLVAGSDRDILILLYNSCNGDGWYSHEGWMDKSKPVCDWYGIECVLQDYENNSKMQEEKVVKIELPQNNMDGILPVRLLLQMPDLQVLDLSGNEFSWRNENNSDLVQSSISYLDLSATNLNNLAGIFTQVEMDDITDLRLGLNDLFGDFPPEIYNFRRTLKRLDLESNNLNGKFPENISQFGRLEELNLANNYFEGYIPTAITELTKLKKLNLRGNHLSGTLPDGLDKLLELEQLDLSRLSLTGRIPMFSESTQLERLDLSYNSFTGRIQEKFLESVNPDTFGVAYLNSNQFNGVLPRRPFLRLPVGSIHIEDNQISIIPRQLCNPNRGGEIARFGCDAILCPLYSYAKGGRQTEDESCLHCDTAPYLGSSTCPIDVPDSTPLYPSSPSVPSPPSSPTSPYGSESMGGELAYPAQTDIDILVTIYNDCGGDKWIHNDGWTSPQSICEWYGVTCADDGSESVKYLMLSNNNLKGNIATSVYNLHHLESLSLSHNDIIVNFFGIENARFLTILDLQNTNIFSVREIEKAPNLVELDLSDNELNGGIPTNIFALTSLHELKLDGNQLTGGLPFDLKQLENLELFSASDNKLTGFLSDSFSLLRNIHTLNLRSNSLRGPINDILNSMTSLINLDLSRQIDSSTEQILSGFSGPVPDFEDHKNLRRVDLSHNNLSGNIPTNFLQSVLPTSFEYANLASNRITGPIPARLNELQEIYLQDNMIDSIPKELCSGLGVLDQFGCDAILCAPGTFNVLGRVQSFDSTCQKCPEAQYFGAISCPPTDFHSLPVPIPYTPQLPVSPATPVSPVSSGSSSERDILEQIYKQCGGDNWINNDGWMDTGVDICDWQGVKCDVYDKIERVVLKSNNLIGTPPSQIFNLESLTEITLEGNSINFDFTGIENAKKLTTLDLSHTDIESVVGIQKSTTIEHLYLSSTNLRGEFPIEILELRELLDLALIFNDISGTIPPQIANLANLEYLAIHDNRLSGYLPSALGQLKNLQFFLAGHNDLSGSIPNEISTLSHLWSLDIANQRSFGGMGLTGKVPSFNGLAELRKLDLSSNSLTGELPSDLLRSVSLDSFEYVDLRNNQIGGRVPNFNDNLPIEGIYLSNNKFTGIDERLCDASRSYQTGKYGCDAILCPPFSFNDLGKQDRDTNPCSQCRERVSSFFGSTSCTGLPTLPPATIDSNPTYPSSGYTGSKEKNILEIFYNECGGSNWERNDNWMNDSSSICEWFGIRCTDTPNGKFVQYILLSSNNLVGVPPVELFQLEYLDTLVLDNNAISFDFTGIANAENLATIDLSSTRITSLDGISGAKKLKNLELTSNDLQGTLPDELFLIPSLQQLSLDYNQFRGPLPINMDNLANLHLFSCAFNKLSGPLPFTMGHMTNLVTLRLQSNSLSGTIPDVLGEMTNLAFIDLSQQKSDTNIGLKGPIPDLAQLQNIRKIDLKFNNLSGAVPSTLLQAANSDYVNLIDFSFNQITGKLPSSLSKFGHIHLQGNKISEIDDSFCGVAFGCDGFLCPPQTFSPSGGMQQSSTSICQPCPSVKYYGSTTCGEISESTGVNVNTPVSFPTSESQSPPLPLPQPQVPSPSPPELVGDPPGNTMSDKDILVLLYTQCKGERWHYRDNWMTTASICSWNGITCKSDTEYVERIDLGANNVVGTPPVELYQLKYLKALVLYSNPLSNFDFNWIKEARSLEELILDATGIDDMKGIERAPSLKKIKLRFNEIRGNLGGITDIKTLEFLSISNNHLTGTVPSDFDNLKNLEALLLGDNHLEGNIGSVRLPDSLSILDFSSNDLTGPIPTSFLTEFRNSADLSVDISGNQLTGSVPSALARFSQLELFLHDNKLTHIDEAICKQENWNAGDIGRYGCKGLMCPRGKSSPVGRQTDTYKCTFCRHAKHLGSTACHNGQSSNGIRHASSGGTLGLITGLSCLLAFLIN